MIRTALAIVGGFWVLRHFFKVWALLPWVLLVVWCILNGLAGVRA